MSGLLDYWIVGLIGMTALLCGCERRVAAPAPSYETVTNLVGEIMPVGEFHRSPEVNHAGTELVFMRSAEKRRGLFRVDVASGKVEEMTNRLDALMLFGWSEDDRHLLLKDSSYGEWLRLYDEEERTFKRVDKDKGMNIGQALWMRTNEFVYTAEKGKAPELRLVRVGGEQKTARKLASGLVDWLTPMSERQVGYAENTNICSLDLGTGQAVQLTTNLCSEHAWLNYSRENQAFLFCAWNGSEWRHLYRYDLGEGSERKLTQLTFGPDHTYNGQWIQKGTGYAYVGNVTNHFYLAVRPGDAKLGTNLFWGGHVLAYRVSGDGEKIYAAAAGVMEPPAIWEYDIGEMALRRVVPGTSEPFKVTKVAPSKEQWVKSSDGLEVPFYLLRPTDLDKKRRHPVVIAIPPEAGQFVQAWERYGQFLANLGCYYAAVNPRGSDGYTATYRRKHDDEDGRGQDLLAARADVLSDPSADPERVFLMTWSNGGVVADKLATEKPDLWNGVILISAAPPGRLAGERKPPRFLLFGGEQDLKIKPQELRDFQAFGKTKGVEVRLVTDKRTQHVITDVNVDKKIGLALAEFIYKTNYGGASLVLEKGRNPPQAQPPLAKVAPEN